MGHMTQVEQLRSIVVKLGFTPKGDTTAELIDEIEDHLSAGGGGGSVTPAQIEAAVESYMEENKGELDDSDFDDIFGD